MIDMLVQGFVNVQAWIFEHAVQPPMYHLGLMEFAEDAYEAVETVMIGVAEITLLCMVLKPLETWLPVEKWRDRVAVRADVIYTWLHRLGVLPFAIFLLLVIPVNALDGWLRMQDIVRPNIEDVIPGLARNSIGAFIIYVLVIDFTEYCMHRFQHRWNWWWALHSLHHSQRQMSFWTDDRNHLLDDIFTSAIVAIVALAIGVPSNQFLVIIFLTRIVESLSHVNARMHFGAIGNRLLVSPLFHRTHHAIGVGHEGTYQGCNFATLFPIWDILFRTANFKTEFYSTGVRDQLDGRDYGTGFWRQQWLGLLRMRDAILRRQTV